MVRPIETDMIGNVGILPGSPRQIATQFRRMLESGYRLKVDGLARKDPESLLQNGYTPKYAMDIFDKRLFLCNKRTAQGLKVIPAYVVTRGHSGGGAKSVYARLFYKDSSLVWRSASHYINTPDEHWIGKGAIRWQGKRGARGWFSAEETTNLPFEIQAALDDASQRYARRQNDHRVLSLILHNAPSSRVHPYQDFEGPRTRAMKSARNRINNNRPIAWFEDENDPRSLRFEPGFQPDFRRALDVSSSRSTMYGGAIRKYRFASRNRRIQFLFVAGPHHAWIVNPQAFTVDLSSYALRTVDVIADEDLCIPGYEFHDNDGSGAVDSQIPDGFAGPVCPMDPDRADASPWNERLPVIRSFRRFLSRQ